MGDPLLAGQPACPDNWPWKPLVSQQIRLRHLQRVLIFNTLVPSKDLIYFTLHQSPISPAFYTSEKIESQAVQLRFKPLRFDGTVESSTLAGSLCALRLWQQNSTGGMDSIIVTYVLHLSGLVYLGHNRNLIRPDAFGDYTAILMIHAGYFTARSCFKTSTSSDLSPTSSCEPLPFIDDLTLVSAFGKTYTYRLAYYNCSNASSHMKITYNVEKLRRIRSLQLQLRNRKRETSLLRDKLLATSGLAEPSPVLDSDADGSLSLSRTETASDDSDGEMVRYAPQLLTMTSLNRMLHEPPTRQQKRQIKAATADVEMVRWATRVLSTERDRKAAELRLLKDRYNKEMDDFEEAQSQLMENMRKLSKDKERLRESKEKLIQNRASLLEFSSILSARRRKLMTELLEMYPITTSDNRQFYINGVLLPHSDLINDTSDDSVSVALGYVAHILTMCESFLNVPLRYAINHRGSQSLINDHVTPSPSHLFKERLFPLYSKGKDRAQFSYAVYLLNKDIAQLRWLDHQHTSKLSATLPNLLALIVGKERNRSQENLYSNRAAASSSQSPMADTLTRSRDSLLSGGNSSSSSTYQMSKSLAGTGSLRSLPPSVGNDNTAIVISEAFLSQNRESSFGSYMSELQHTSTLFKTPSAPIAFPSRRADSDCTIVQNSRDDSSSIEEGTDILASSLRPPPTPPNSNIDVLVGATSMTDDDTMPDGDGANTFVRRWLESGPAMVSSEQHLYPDEVLGVSAGTANIVHATGAVSGAQVKTALTQPLTSRTDALVSNNKSFNLVRNKFPSEH